MSALGRGVLPAVISEQEEAKWRRGPERFGVVLIAGSGRRQWETELGGEGILRSCLRIADDRWIAGVPWEGLERGAKGKPWAQAMPGLDILKKLRIQELAKSLYPISSKHLEGQ